MDRLSDIEQFVFGVVSAGIHIVSAAFEFAYVAFGVEGIAQDTTVLHLWYTGGPLYLCNDKCFYPYAASNATCLRSLTRQLCSSSSLPDL